MEYRVLQKIFRSVQIDLKQNVLDVELLDCLDAIPLDATDLEDLIEEIKNISAALRREQENGN